MAFSTIPDALRSLGENVDALTEAVARLAGEVKSAAWSSAVVVTVGMVAVGVIVALE